jgi:LPS-assembly protein
MLAPAAGAAEPACPPPLGAALRQLDAKATEPPPAGERIEITSDEALLGVDGNAELRGNVRVRLGERELRADDISWRQDEQDFQARGSVEYEDPLLRVSGRSGAYSPTRGANFSDAQFELPERSARGTAQELQLSPGGLVRLDDVTFTTCPVTDPAWFLRADRIDLDMPNRLGTGRGARIDFKGVPLMYLPWVSFPLGAERKSGFLFPSAGHSSRGGLQLAVPYYWDIRPNVDLTFEPTVYGRRGIDLAGELRYLSPRHQGQLDWNWLPRDEDAKRYRAFGQLRHGSTLPGDWRLAVNATTVSDRRYFEDFGLGTEGASVIFVERFAQLAYRDQTWRLAAEVQQFQTFDEELGLPDRPYARLPRLTAGAEFARGPLLRFGFDTELVNFYRNVGVTGWRLDARPGVSLDAQAAGYYVRPSVHWRFTQYALDSAAPGASRSPTRALPEAAFDTGAVFERLAGPAGERRVTLEPRLLYVYVPFRSQDELPLFDTIVPDLNLPQLFRTNRYVGADRVSDANEVSVGLTSRLLDSASGAQFLSATLGQSFYFQSPRVRLPGEQLEQRQRSDLIAQLAVTGWRHVNADAGLQWNPQRDGAERGQVNLQYRPAAGQVLNLGYRYQRDRLQTEGLEQVEASAAWPLGRQWHGFARYVHSLRDEQAIERYAGFEYRACCWRLRLVGRRYLRSRTGEEDTGIYLQLELAGLASVGSSADAFLEATIRGYSRPEVIP